jgi:putative transposase
MNNHYHLVVETPDGNLSKGMRQLNGVYTQAFNKRQGRVGHVFQGRFKGILVQKDTHFLEVCRYVVLNPVRANTVRHPRQWKWSSYSATAGIVQPHGCLSIDEILSHFGQRKAIAQEKYCAFVQDGIDSPSIWDHLKAQSLLGVEGFAEGAAPSGDRKATDSRDSERTKIRWATDFGEAIFTEKSGQNIEEPTHRQSCHRLRL